MISASPRRLSVFKHVVETGGFNAAATELGIAQPSVCAHVKALESQVGQPLFFRHRGSRPKLTKAGEALYGFALDMLRKSEEATDALADIRSSEARAITIAVHRDVAPFFLRAPLGAFTRKHPRTRIVTRIGTIEDVLELCATRPPTSASCCRRVRRAGCSRMCCGASRSGLSPHPAIRWRGARRLLPPSSRSVRSSPACGIRAISRWRRRRSNEWACRPAGW